MTENAQVVPQLPHKRKRIGKDEARMMASLVAKRIDETGACLMLGIKPKQWFNWKYHAKNKEHFAELLTHVREAKLNACLEAIDEAGDGNPDKGQRPDWRAKAWLAERVLAPERYLQKVEPAQPQQVTITIAPSLAADIFKLPELKDAMPKPKEIGNG